MTDGKHSGTDDLSQDGGITRDEALRLWKNTSASPQFEILESFLLSRAALIYSLPTYLGRHLLSIRIRSMKPTTMSFHGMRGKENPK